MQAAVIATSSSESIKEDASDGNADAELVAVAVAGAAALLVPRTQGMNVDDVVVVEMDVAVASVIGDADGTDSGGDIVDDEAKDAKLEDEELNDRELPYTSANQVSNHVCWCRGS